MNPKGNQNGSVTRHVSKRLKPIVRAAISQGFKLELTGKKHIKWVPPNSNLPFVISSGTPSDRRALARIKRDLHNIAGMDITGL